MAGVFHHGTILNHAKLNIFDVNVMFSCFRSKIDTHDLKHLF